uniref:ARAD1D41734p n=1 Tax=Blastobotrys adeninivorans TaxID=409370 RepID=A0A060TIW5_BLAAD
MPVRCQCSSVNAPVCSDDEDAEAIRQLRSRLDARKRSGNKKRSPKAPAREEQMIRNKRTVSLAKAGVLLSLQLPLITARPIMRALGLPAESGGEPELTPSKDPQGFWVNMSVSIALVLLGGVFAGLTLGLMGQDEVYLQVMEQSGEASEKKCARRVLKLLKRGKHWVLVTLLLSNVITNETLPIVLDRCLGGGWPAVVSSTIAIVIFGEIIPQSISVRYGLSVGATFAPFVLALMYIMYPVAYPVAMLLDYILGEDHGTVYKRAGLKTLVTLHQNMGVERLNEDEVTIISAVLDLKEKPVGTVMTPMQDVFVMSSDRILDEATIEEILHTGFNRIPIHAPGEPQNFIGMLLVRILISYDPEDALPISSFPLSTLPETHPDTSCLNILNYFQEGKSHMVIVSERPGEPVGALGVVTLEDVIEELIGEEIVDESDVYIDVHKAIRRTVPGPLTKRLSVGGHSIHSPPKESPNNSNGQTPQPSIQQPLQASPSVADTFTLPKGRPKLEPVNLASNPRRTGNRSVHIKTNIAALSSNSGTPQNDSKRNSVSNGASRAEDSEHFHSHANGVQIQVNRSEHGAVRSALDADSNTLHVNGYGTIPEVHSYRTGGIIESVVNVDGIKKTVIEDVSDDDGSRERRNSDNSRTSSRSNGSRSPFTTDRPSENQPLLSP